MKVQVAIRMPPVRKPRADRRQQAMDLLDPLPPPLSRDARDKLRERETRHDRARDKVIVREPLEYKSLITRARRGEFAVNGAIWCGNIPTTNVDFNARILGEWERWKADSDAETRNSCLLQLSHLSIECGHDENKED